MTAHIIKPNLEIQEGDKLVRGREVLHISRISRQDDGLVLDVIEGSEISIKSYGLSAVAI